MAELRLRPSTCPRCDLPAGPGLRYCGRCGLDFHATPAQSAPAALPPVPASIPVGVAGSHRSVLGAPAGLAVVRSEEIPGIDPDADLRGRKKRGRGNRADPLLSLQRGGGRLSFERDRPAHLLNAPALAMLVMGLSATAGALLAWFTVASAEIGTVTRSGFEMGAFGTLALMAGIALAISGGARALHAGSLALVQLVGLVAGVALIAVFVWEFMAMDSVARGMIGSGSGVAGLGVGLLLVLVAGVGGVVFVGLISKADE